MKKSYEPGKIMLEVSVDKNQILSIIDQINTKTAELNHLASVLLEACKLT